MSVYLLTITMGYVVFQIAGRLSGFGTLRLDGTPTVPALVQLWPMVENETPWPRRVGISSSALDAFSKRMDFLR